MMRQVYIFAIGIFALCSCNSQNSKTPETQENKISLIGKWYRFSTENGYTEFDIDSQNVVFYNQKVGRFNLPYKLENDSLKYLSHNYAGKVTDYGDSVLLEGNDSTKATLYKFKIPHIPFNTIPEEKDSTLFASYVKGFDERLIREFEKAGIDITKPTPKSDNATYEDLLNNKNGQ